MWDTETNSLYPDENGEMVQIACVGIDPRTLSIIPGSEFESLMKPVQILSGSEAEIRTKWNKCNGAWEKNKMTRKKLENAPLPEHVLKAFSDHVKQYNGKGFNGRPIACGHNIQGFDLPWLDMLCKRHKIACDKNGKQNIFNSRTILDTLNLCFLWWEDLPEPPSLGMDILRPWLGFSSEGAHTADNDVAVCAEMLISFMKIHRRFAKKVNFKGAFGPKNLPSLETN